MLASNHTQCTVCHAEDLKTTIDFGLQPPANRFDSDSQEQECYPLAFGYCQACKTAQLTKRIPFHAIRPKYDWLLYNEPEGHLDDAAESLLILPGIDNTSRILGVTYKDQSTIDRLLRLGVSEGRYVAENDFTDDSKPFGLETIQSLLRKHEIINSIKKKYGQADILLMRHIIEHSDNAAELVLSLKPLIRNNGYLVMELPDSEKLLKAGNHPFIWEEHISYFTEKTIYALAANVDAKIAWFKIYPYPYEDSIMVAFQFSENDADTQIVSNKIPDESDLNDFSKCFDATKSEWHQKLKAYKDKGEKVAVFGAGHLSAKFINFYQLTDLIDCVIDDNQHKVGKNMPGSLLPIVPSAELDKQGIKVCISTLSPESEAKVRMKFKGYFDNGGVFVPAFSVIGG